MATIVENLTKLFQIKKGIRNAISDKGVDMTNIPFEQFPSKINEIEGGGQGEGNANVTFSTVGNYYADWDKYDVKDGYVTYEGEEYHCPEIPSKRILVEENSEDARNKLVCKVKDNYTYTVNNVTLHNDEVYELPDSKMNNMYALMMLCQYVTEIVNMPSTSQTQTLEYLFSQCSSLLSIPIEYIDTSNVTNMNATFNGCSALTTLDLSNFDVSKVTSMNNLFYYCSNLTELDLSTWNINTSILTNYNAMFEGTNNLQDIYAYACPNETYCFLKKVLGGRQNIIRIGTPTGNKRLSDIEGTVDDGFDQFVVQFYQDEYSNPRYEGTEWYDVNQDEYEIISVIKGGGIRNGKTLDMTVSGTVSYMIQGLYYSWTTDTHNVFVDTDNVTKIKDYSGQLIDGGNSNILSINRMPCFKNVNELNFLVYNCTNLTYLCPFAITSTTTNVSYMFGIASKLEKIDCSYFDWSGITNMENMFYYCTSLKEIDMSNCNLQGNPSTNGIFERVNTLEKIYMRYATEEAYNIINGIKPQGCVIDYYAPTEEWRIPEDAEEVELKIGKLLLTVKYKEIKFFDTIFDGEDEWRLTDEYEIISSIEREDSITVELNDQWQPLTYSSNALEGYDVYESFSNYHIGSGRAKMRITFLGYPNLVLKYRSDAESRFDYLMLSKLDTEIGDSDNVYSTNTVLYHTNSKQNQWYDAEYENDGGDHFIEVVYMKDGSADTEPDKGFVGIPI